MTEVTPAMIGAGHVAEDVWFDTGLDKPPRYAAIYLAMEAARIPAAPDDVERLRAALINIGREAGCFLSDNVSTDFLLLIPAEVKGRISAIPIPAPTAPDVVERVARAAACAAMKADITKWFAALTDHTTKDDLTEQGEMS